MKNEILDKIEIDKLELQNKIDKKVDIENIESHAFKVSNDISND